MLQRDLAARQRREGDPPVVTASIPSSTSPSSIGARRLEKTEAESAWNRAKLEMETDDFLDALADNPSGTFILPFYALVPSRTSAVILS